MRATVAMMIISTITRKNHPARTRHKSFSLPAAQLGTPPLTKQKRRQVYKRVCARLFVCRLNAQLKLPLDRITLENNRISKKKKSTASKPKIQTRLYHLPKKKNDACFPINFRYAICRCPVQAHINAQTRITVKSRNVITWCACHYEKKCRTLMAIMTSDTDDTSSKQQQAQRKQKYNKRKRKRPVSSVDHCHPYTRKQRSSYLSYTCCSLFLKFCRTWTKRYL